jgi:hypothetical protein
MLFILLELKGIIKQYCEDYESELEEDILSYAD